MDKYLEALQEASNNHTFTANGALTHSTTLNKCLDFFFVAGNHISNQTEFFDAFSENPDIALKILFWSRDCRGGAGARKNFQIVMQRLQKTNPSLFTKLYQHIPEYGYWKDIFKLEPTTELVKFVAKNLRSSNPSLVAKYCPRKGDWFNAVRKYMRLTPKQFRKLLVHNTQVVENKMCANEWDTINYAYVPSVASNMYRKAFYKHDVERYSEYIKDVLEGKEKINASVLYPHQLYQAYNNTPKKERNSSIISKAIEAQWNNLPDYMGNSREKILPICDVSSSMTGLPMDISISLGCYISERNKGTFKDAFITFSEKPQLNILSGDIINRFRQLEKADWGRNTDLQAVFDLVLDTAVLNHVPVEDMPTKLLIISDMHFDLANGYNNKVNFDVIKQRYLEFDYDMPEVIFWNVNGSLGNYPATAYEDKVGMVSGYSPALLTNILKGKALNPTQLMLSIVDTERYRVIHS